MKQDVITALIRGEYADPQTGRPLQVPTRFVTIAKDLQEMEAECVAALNMGRRLAVVSDSSTWQAMGQRIEKSLASIARIQPVHLGEKPHPDMATIDLLRNETAAADGLIAVGSGTINDLCKYASACDDKPYAVFATAPSMNGYTSVNASITVNGMKKTLPARGALAVYIDLSVLAQAPPRLIRSGLGDSVCRSTAQADWLLAHLLFDKPYREAPFAMLAEYEVDLFTHSDALIQGDLEVMALLARTLVVSGFGMTICGGSEPASQGEHLISHVIEMLADPAWPVTFHGEQIGVTTLTMAGLQEKIITGGPPYVRPGTVKKQEVLSFWGAGLGEACWSELAKKMPDEQIAAAVNNKLEASWPAMQKYIQSIIKSSGEIEAILRRAGAPVTALELHVPDPFYRDAVRHARQVRDRYTFLDLAGDSGKL